MKKGFVLCVLLTVCLVWPANTALAEWVTEETVEPVPLAIEKSWKVTVTEEQKEPFELSQEAKSLWEEFYYYRQLEAQSGIRSQLSEDTGAGVPTMEGVPVTNLEETPIANLEQPQSPGVFQFVIKHQLTPSENPNLKIASMPSVGYAQMKKGFMVYNSGAARSNDHGATWSYVNPNIGSPGAGFIFSGKQEVIWDGFYNTHLWIQLWLHPSGGGAITLGVSRNLNTWYWYLIMYNPAGTFFDDPRIRIGHDYGLMTWDEYTNGGGAWQQSAIARIPLAPMMRFDPLPWPPASMGDLTYDTSYRHFLPAKNNRHSSTAYFVSNGSIVVGNVKVVEWPEGRTAQSVHTFGGLAGWVFGSMICTCNDGKNPCQPLTVYDDRVRAAVVAKHPLFPEASKRQLWVSFNVGQDATRPFPYTYLVKFNINNWTLIGYDHYAWGNVALQNLDMAANAQGDILMVWEQLGGTSGGWWNAFCAAILDGDINDFSWVHNYSIISNGNVCHTPTPSNPWGHQTSVNPWWRNQYQGTAVGRVLYSTGPRNWYVRFTNSDYFP